MERARATLWHRARRGERVAAPDEFFLHVESAEVPQPVGGYILLGLGAGQAPPDVAQVCRLLTQRIARMPRFTSRLQPPGLLRHSRWVPTEVRLEDHVREYRLPAPGGHDGLVRLASRLSEQQLDRSRPLWQLWIVPEVGRRKAAVIGIMHHAIADGLGVVDILRQLFDPELPLPDLSGLRRPAWPVRAAAAVTGLAQLAADGRAQPLPTTLPLTGRRSYRTRTVPLATVRAASRRTGARITELLLAATGQALSEVLAERGEQLAGRRLRVALPVTTRVPAPAATGWHAEAGNKTAALRVDVPLGPMRPEERLRRTARNAERGRRSGRALATGLVMRALGLLPPALHRLVARRIYSGRFLAAIVSNMPGPSTQLYFTGLPIGDTYPILPLADRVPLGVGTLGWGEQFCLSVLTDSAVLPEADRLAERMAATIVEMASDRAASDRAASDRADEAAGTAPARPTPAAAAARVRRSRADARS